MRRFFDGDRTITLRDVRTLGYCMLGDPRGQPVIFVGDYPGSRMMARLFDGALERGIRLVGIDHPGGHAGFAGVLHDVEIPGRSSSSRTFTCTAALPRYAVSCPS